MTKRLLILGGGFGMYGYLPAAIYRGFNVSTLDRYQATIQERFELREFLSEINFIGSEPLKFDDYDAVVIARTPAQQMELVKQNLNYRGHFFLEKPLGNSLTNHSKLLDILIRNHLRFSVAYLFRYAEWYKPAIDSIVLGEPLRILWSLPHGESESWKKVESDGGGLLTYYGIHLLSLLAEAKISKDSLRLSSAENLIEIFSRNKKISFQIYYSSNSSFKVYTGESDAIPKWDLYSPFGSTPAKGLRDPRIEMLSEYLACIDAGMNNATYANLEIAILELRTCLESLL